MPGTRLSLEPTSVKLRCLTLHHDINVRALVLIPLSVFFAVIDCLSPLLQCPVFFLSGDVLPLWLVRVSATLEAGVSLSNTAVCLDNILTSLVDYVEASRIAERPVPALAQAQAHIQVPQGRFYQPTLVHITGSDISVPTQLPLT